MPATEIRYSYKHAPTLKAFAEGNAFIRGLVGPVGGGKSACCVVEIIARAMAQKPGPDGIRRTRWAVIRNTFGELRDTTIKTFHDWVPPALFGNYHATNHEYTITGFKGVVIEVIFRALDRPDHVKKLLSLELTGAWVNEAREVPWPLLDALTGRVDRYPSKRIGGATWAGIFMDTNPPDVDSEWFKFFEDADHSEAVAALAERIPGMTVDKFCAIFKQPSGLSPMAENLPNLATGYYQRLAIGKSAEWIKVYLKGEYGYVQEGKPVFPEFSDTLHMGNAKTIQDAPVYRGWDFGLCYSDDTEVLTTAGWKLFRDVDVEADHIATRDPVSGAMEYAKAAFKVAEPFNGELLEWSSTELSMLVTPEHRVPFTHRETPDVVRWESAQWLADHMGGHHYVDLVSAWAAPDFDPNRRWFGCDATVWAEFLGIYLAEGSADAKRVVVYQNNRDPEIQRILDATGWDWRWKGNGAKASGWRLYDPMIAPSIAALGVSGTKRVPAEVKQMPSCVIRKFIMSYTLGDGHIRTRPNGAVEHTLFTISPTMAADMQDLAQKTGWNSSVRVVQAQTSYIQEGSALRAITNNGGYCVTFKKSATRAELHRRNFRRVPYNGTVYCLNVPHHTLYVRRNGKPHWNGNTPACVFSQLTPSGQWCVVDEMVSESMGIDRFSDAVLEHSALNFPRREFIDIGDPAGEQRAQTDERTCFQIMRAKGIDIQPAPQSEMIRLESMRKALNSLADGKPRFVLHPRCQILRKGFLGGYAYRRRKVSGEAYDPHPEKNRFSHPMDAATYTSAWIFGGGLTTPKQRDDEDELVFSTRSANPVTGY